MGMVYNSPTTIWQTAERDRYRWSLSQSKRSVLRVGQNRCDDVGLPSWARGSVSYVVAVA